MVRHLSFSAIGSAAFLVVTLVVAKIFGTGIQVEGFTAALNSGNLLRTILTDATILGAVSGGLASMVFRKSMNHRVYTLVTIILLLIFFEFVLVSIF
ncbi:MAG: hypothetical protein FJZ78_10505 [Bacteroidetes bacterium]|nr:hypothetical protein [Bacteroidota bacterium]